MWALPCVAARMDGQVGFPRECFAAKAHKGFRVGITMEFLVSPQITGLRNAKENLFSSNLKLSFPTFVYPSASKPKRDITHGRNIPA